MVLSLISITSTLRGSFEGTATPTTGGPQFCVRWVTLPGSSRYLKEVSQGEKGSGDAHPYLSLFDGNF